MATITVSELAEVLDTDPRTARKFLRSVTPKDECPGKGSRWEIEKKGVRSLKVKYAAFVAAQVTKAEVETHDSEADADDEG